MTKQIEHTGFIPKLLTHTPKKETPMSEKARVVSFAQTMAETTDEQLNHNMRVWQREQKRIMEKRERKEREMFNRPFAKALAMVRANTHKKS